jgi:hypothetical protein
MQRYHRRVFAFSGLLIYLVISQLSMPTLVMCFGKNGHLAVESTHAPTQPAGTQEHGGPCLDAPLLVTMRSGLVLSAHLPLLHVVVAWPSHEVSVASSPTPFFQALMPPSLLASLRSMLLLI